MTILALSTLLVMIPPLETVSFDTTDFMLWFPTDHKVQSGVDELHLDIVFKSPCLLDEHDDWHSIYDLKNISYSHLQQLFTDEFNEIIQEVNSMKDCLPPGSTEVRHKRALPAAIVYGMYAVVVYAASQVGYIIWTDHERVVSVEDRANRIVQTIKTFEEDSKAKRVDALKLNTDVAIKAENNRQAIVEQATINANIAWTSSKLAVRLQRYKDGLKQIRSACQQGFLSLRGLDEIVMIT